MTKTEETRLRKHLAQLALTGGEPDEPLGSGAYRATIDEIHRSALSEDDRCMLSTLVVFMEEWEGVSPECMLPLHAVVAAALDGPEETRLLNQVITHGWVKPMVLSRHPDASKRLDA